MQTNDPRVLALGNFGFAEGAQRLAEKMHRGMVEHASAEDQAAAVTAAQALLRHAPKAIRTIVEIELIAEAVIRDHDQRRDAIMTHLFEPQTE